MSQIEKLDPNFKVPENAGQPDMVFYDCLQPPFSIHGLLLPQQAGEAFLRMPAAAAAKVSEGVSALNGNTAGGRVRFQTDSPCVAIRAGLHAVGKMPHFALTGSAGFDLYYRQPGEEERYGGSFIPPFATEEGYEARVLLPVPRSDRALREITLNFPLYSGVKSLQIGLLPGSALLSAEDYRCPRPAVFYGSSITQGGCASRPGNAYPAIISRRLGCDFLNLGFSGNAKGEEEMAEYIASLSMSAFVYDYDYNAPDVRHLQNTHERMFLCIRQRQPLLPVVIVSRPQPFLNEEERERLQIIKATYERALARGDGHVYFVDGSRLLRRFGGDSGTVDRCHPNDLGFLCMAEGIGEALELALEEAENE